MGFLGMSGKTWKKVGKYALKAAPLVAAPFTGGLSLLALGAGTGAVSGALDGGGWKGALIGGGLGAIPGGGGIGNAAGGAAKVGLKEIAKGVAKGAATNFATGTGTGLVTGQGLKSSLAGGGGSALSGLGTSGAGGFGQAAKTIGTNVALNAGGAYAGKALQQAGVPGGIAAQGGNVFSNYLGNNLTGGGGTPTFDSVGGGTGGTGGAKPASWAERWGPLIAQGAGVAAGAVVGRQAQKNALKRSPEEQLALGGAQRAAGDVGRLGNQLAQQGQDYLQKPGQYFQSLLGGNRAAMSQAVAGPTAQITGNYRGAERALNQSGIRGAGRDVAMADLNRQRVSQIAGLTTGMQPYAAEQLAGMGQNTLQQGAGALAASGNIYSNLLGQGAVNREYSRSEGAATAGAIGGLARDAGEVVFKKSPAPGTPAPTDTKTGQPQGSTPQRSPTQTTGRSPRRPVQVGAPNQQPWGYPNPPGQVRVSGDYQNG